MNAFLAGSYTLWQREVVRFLRQPSRLMGAFGSPLIFWALIGSGIGSSFKGSSGGYLAYFFPGTILMILFFTAVFSTISLIEDRREGFMQAVLVAPAPRAAVVFGKVLGGSTLAFFQSLLFLAFAPVIGIKLSLLGLLRVCGVIFLDAFLMTTLGFLVAWQFTSIQGFHAVMNLLLMPMWMLSGALFPASGASGWIRLIMRINPLSYSYDALNFSLTGQGGPDGFLFSFGITAVLAVLFFAAAAWDVSRPSLKNL